jgi:hypothetical protein
MFPSPRLRGVPGVVYRVSSLVQTKVAGQRLATAVCQLMEKSANASAFTETYAVGARLSSVKAQRFLTARSIPNCLPCGNPLMLAALTCFTTSTINPSPSPLHNLYAALSVLSSASHLLRGASIQSVDKFSYVISNAGAERVINHNKVVSALIRLRVIPLYFPRFQMFA